MEKQGFITEVPERLQSALVDDAEVSSEEDFKDSEEDIPEAA
jgi:hypothetical protein